MQEETMQTEQQQPEQQQPQQQPEQQTQQQQTEQQQTEQQQTQQQVIAYEDARQLVVDAVSAANASNAETLRTALAENGTSPSDVTLESEQYDTISSLMAATMQGQVIAIGLCALIAGLLIVLIVTIHWRLR